MAEETVGQRLERRTYETYLNRVKATERLQRQDRLWTAALVGSSLVSALASVVLLVDGAAFGERGAILLTLLTIATLVASLAVSSLRLPERVRDMRTHYRAVQRLSCEIELANSTGQASFDLANRWQRRYDDLLDEVENHTTLDRMVAKASIRSDPGRHYKDGAAKVAWLLIGTVTPIALLGAALGVGTAVMLWLFKGS